MSISAIAQNLGTAVNPQLSSPIGPQPAKTKDVADAQSEALTRRREEAEKAAQDFETLFVDMMVKSMRQTAKPEEVSNAQDVYQGMLDSEYSKAMTAANNFGIREKIIEWMEQSDPTLKQAPTATEKPNTEKSSQISSDASKMQNEMWALKAASQAYQLSSQAR